MSDIDLKICLSLYGRKNKPSLNFNPKIVRFKQFKLHFFTVILDRFRFHVFMTERQVPSSNINYLYHYICTSNMDYAKLQVEASDTSLSMFQ
jgi:hypothetical protein